MTITREEVIRVARECGIEFQQNQGITGRVSTTTYGSQSIDRIERLAQHFYEAGAAAAREPLVAEIERLKKDCKLYAGVIAYGADVVFQRGEETTDEEAMAAIDAKSAEINQAAHNIGSKT